MGFLFVFIMRNPSTCNEPTTTLKFTKVMPNPRLHDTTCCQTGLTTGYIVYTKHQPVVKTGLTTGLTTGWITNSCSFNTVVKPPWQPVVSCKRGISVLLAVHRGLCHILHPYNYIAPLFPFLTVSTPAFWCRCFMSRIFSRSLKFSSSTR